MSIQPLFLAGPTAVGKSDLAVAIAEQCNGEIVGADAFQVYRGLELLTAKPDVSALERVRHHLIGEIPLTETFDVARYHELATERMAEITARGKTPVVVGGTGLYIRALTHGLAELPEPDEALRAELSAQPLDVLMDRLSKLDPVCAVQIDRQNPRRVIRALEVCLLTGRPFSEFRKEWKASPAMNGVVLTRERGDLYTRIDRRTEEMFRAGVVEEVREAGDVSETAAQAIGFQEIRELLAGRLSESECIAQIQQQTRNYAKRQLTWFRKEKHFQTVEVQSQELSDSVMRRIVTAIGNF
jgi:tRNA dimethylallyltransferase